MTMNDTNFSLIDARREARTEWVFRFVLLGLLCLIFIPFMGSFGLWDPWETHYGEVGRQMIERGDWVSPWWGGHWRDGGGGQEGSYFYSKPVLLLWMMGLGMQLFGFSEWGVRLGVGLTVILASLMIYVAGRQIWSRRAGIIMMLVTATSPFWAMLGRQAQTDMPFVGMMTIGMAFFMMAVFGGRREEKAEKLDWAMLVVFFLVLFLPMMQLLWVKFPTWRSDIRIDAALWRFGPLQVALYSALIVLVGVSFWRRRATTTKRQIYMMAFYVFIALATLAKGLLGFMLPGLIILVYLLVTREWFLLRRVELVRGLVVFLCIAFPWYVAMIVRHGREYIDRFFVHDHLRRLSSGVHQIDNGSFEHFIKWLGYGLFPWGSFVPVALARVVYGRDVGRRTDAQRARLLLIIWFVVSFALFTLASTKFHHYIFPCVPALAMLVGLYLDDWLKGEVKSAWPMHLLAIALFVLVGYDIFAEPQVLKNLFTYQYDRMWPSDLTAGFVSTLKIIFWVGLAGFLLFVFRRRWLRAAALTVVMVASTSLTVWALNVYMPRLGPEWSQGYLWDTYYDLCTRIAGPEGAPAMKRYCREPVVAYRLNWRGETYYTQNEVIPLEDESDYHYFLQENGGRSFFAIMQRGRLSSFRAGLPAELRSGVDEVHTENLKFILVRVLNPEDREARQALRHERGDPGASRP
jgi:4-amino-4-deoxy-L-arabinose transferase-like glycosyltransferase